MYWSPCIQGSKLNTGSVSVGSILSIPAWPGPPPSAAVPEPCCKCVELELEQQIGPDADEWHGERISARIAVTELLCRLLSCQCCGLCCAWG